MDFLRNIVECSAACLSSLYGATGRRRSSLRRTAGLSRGLQAVAISTSVALVLTVGGSVVPVLQRAIAAPSNAAIQSKQAEVDAARSYIDNLTAEVELASEAYFLAEEALTSIETSIAATEVRLAEAEEKLLKQQRKLSERVSSIYRQGQGSIFDVILGVSSFEDFINAFSFMQRIGESDAEMLVAIRETRAEIKLAREQLEAQRVAQQAAVDDASAKHQAVQAKLTAQQSYLSSLNGELQDLIKAEERRQEEAARAAAAAAAAAAAESAASNSGGSSGGTYTGPISGGRQFDGNVGDPHPQVVDVARSFIGVVDYVWGGTTPSGFDCSGLTMYCYRQIGINIPRTSTSQYAYRAGDFIPADRLDLLQPGDLLFFGYDRDPGRVHHVAIYSGGGMMIHAPRTGVKVSETPLSARGDYVGAVRP